MAKKKKSNGLPKKYAKLGFAKGWKAYKAAKRAAAAKRKKGTKKKAVKKHNPAKKPTKKTAKKAAPKKKKNGGLAAMWIKKAGGNLAKAWRMKKAGTGATSTKKKRSSTTMAKKKKSKKTGGSRRSVALLSPKVMNALVSGAAGGAGLVGGTAAINMLPVIKDQKTWLKALLQFLIGVAGLTFFKDKYMKMAFTGTTIGSIVTAAYPYLPENLKLAGRDFTREELAELATLGILDEDTDVSDVLEGEDNELGIIDEDTEVPSMGRGRYQTTAIDAY